MTPSVADSRRSGSTTPAATGCSALWNTPGRSRAIASLSIGGRDRDVVLPVDEQPGRRDRDLLVELPARWVVVRRPAIAASADALDPPGHQEPAVGGSGDGVDRVEAAQVAQRQPAPDRR